MKKIFLCTISIIVFFTTKAQDLIVLKNAQEHVVKILTITNDIISYKRWNNLDGPTYVVPKLEVFYIKYENGERYVVDNNFFNNTTPNKQNGNPVQVAFQGYGNLGVGFGKMEVGPTLDFSIGINIHNCAYIGVASGFHTSFIPYEYYDEYSQTNRNATILYGYIPIGANIKGFFNPKEELLIFANSSLGGFLGIKEIRGLNGLLFQVGAGLDYKRFIFEMGYTLLYAASYQGIDLNILPNLFTIGHGGYARIGIRFGRSIYK